MIKFAIFSIICIILQFILFIPFYLEWKKDCSIIGEKHLAVSLKHRFLAWLIIFPLWFAPILIFIIIIKTGVL